MAGIDDISEEVIARIASRVLEQLRQPASVRAWEPAEPRRLTETQFIVVRLAMAGATSREIGQPLGISPKTVEVHRARVASRLGVRTFADAVVLLSAIGVLPDYARLGREAPRGLPEEILPESELARRRGEA